MFAGYAERNFPNIRKNKTKKIILLNKKKTNHFLLIIFGFMNKSICLWSCPRNVSTALMYSFSQREDTKVYDESLYAHYLKESGVIHPGRDEILKSQENNGNKVVQNLILKNKSDKIIFHKLMTHFLININTEFLLEVKNIIFIRNPKEIIHSYSKVISSPEMKDIGVKKQYELYHELKKKGIDPIVLDSKYLLINPDVILRKLCLLLDIEFNKKMLHWKEEPIAEDGIWAKYWYKNIHKSNSFIPYSKKEIQLNSNLEKLHLKCLPYYNYLTKKSIKI